jgi:signal transduction histidine kinase
MSEDVRARIFDPFFSTKERGTGLGLAVVQQIVNGFGGQIKVWSRPARGTRFDVWLPRACGDG